MKRIWAWERGGNPDLQKPDEFHVLSRIVHVNVCCCHLVGDACWKSGLRRKFYPDETEEQGSELRCSAWEVGGIDYDGEGWHLDPDCATQRNA